VFGITPNLKVSYCNLPKKIIIIRKGRKEGNQHEREERGKWVNSYLNPLSLSHFLPNLGTLQNHPKWWVKRENTWAPPKSTPPLPLSLPPPNQIPKSPLFSPLHFPFPTNYPNQKLRKCKEEPEEKREGGKKRESRR